MTDLPANAKLRKMQQNTDGLVQLIGAATPNVPNQTPMPQPSKQLLNACPGPRVHITPAFSGVPEQRATKSELAASPLPSRGPNRGRKCFVTPAFLGIPKQRGTKPEVKTYARGNNDAPSISKYGSLVWPDAQIVALR